MDSARRPADAMALRLGPGSIIRNPYDLKLAIAAFWCSGYWRRVELGHVEAPKYFSITLECWQRILVTAPHMDSMPPGFRAKWQPSFDPDILGYINVDNRDWPIVLNWSS